MNKLKEIVKLIVLVILIVGLFITAFYSLICVPQNMLQINSSNQNISASVLGQTWFTFNTNGDSYKAEDKSVGFPFLHVDTTRVTQNNGIDFLSYDNRYIQTSEITNISHSREVSKSWNRLFINDTIKLNAFDASKLPLKYLTHIYFPLKGQFDASTSILTVDSCRFKITSAYANTVEYSDTNSSLAFSYSLNKSDGEITDTITVTAVCPNTILGQVYTL